jgi:hypothetical protein
VDDENPGRIKMQTNDQPTITSCSEEEEDNEKIIEEEEENNEKIM